jgi:hypothetical protein
MPQIAPQLHALPVAQRGGGAARGRGTRVRCRGGARGADRPQRSGGPAKGAGAGWRGPVVDEGKIEEERKAAE